MEALLKGKGVTVIRGEAEFVSAVAVSVKSEGGVYEGKSIIIATGGKARLFPGWVADGEAVITSREALMLKEVPASVAIIGAGPIGLEFATVWRRYGAQVTVLEAMPRPLPLEDEDISREAAAQFARAGITIRAAVKVESFARTDSGVTLSVSTGNGTETITVDKVLVAAGTAPVLENLGLERTGVNLVRGFIDVDDAMRTNAPHIYAIGDVTGKLPLAHTASAQALIAAGAIAGKQVRKLNYDNIPRCIFGHIEVASVGLTEQQARDRGYSVNTARSGFLANGKAVAINENTGFVKVVADERGKLLGIHMIGPHVTELIAGAATIVSLGITAEQAGEVVYPHPTLSEVLAEAIHALSGHSIHG